VQSLYLRIFCKTQGIKKGGKGEKYYKSLEMATVTRRGTEVNIVGSEVK